MLQGLTNKPVCIIQRGKEKSLLLADAVRKGAGGFTRVLYENDGYDVKADETPVIIGVWPTTVEILRQLHAAQRPFVTIDNGYFRPYKEGGYFRATTNSLQWVWSLRSHSDPVSAKARFDALNETIHPLRNPQDGPILVAMQSERWMEMMGKPTWVSDTVARLQRCGKHEIILRHKPIKRAPKQPSLEEHLRGCYAVVGYSSNTLVQAAMLGVPVFPLAQSCAASSLGWGDLDFMGCSHVSEHREDIFHQLAANQWTIDEIASGRMWAELTERYDHFFPELS